MKWVDLDDAAAISRKFQQVLASEEPAPKLSLAVAALLDCYYAICGVRKKYPNDLKDFTETGSSRLAALVTALDERYARVMQAEHFADRFVYRGNDECCQFFQACLRAARYDIKTGSRVLEIGCAEFDWIAEMRRCCPDIDVVGIDWRAKEGAIQGDVLTYDFEPESFDAVVSISTIEHIGLGHYQQDPTDPDGDSRAIARAWRWLKPGGILYFDVPYNPDEYRVVRTSHREYNHDAIWERLWVNPLVEAKGKARWLWEGYAPANHATVLQVERPIQKAHPFWYAGFVWQKVG